MHVRETLVRDADEGVADLVREPFHLDPARPVHEALAVMRETSQHLAVVRTEHGIGVVTLADVLRRLLDEVPA